MAKPEPLKYKKDGYYFFHCTNGKLKFKFGVRGYVYESMMTFEKSLGYNVEVEEVNKEKFMEYYEVELGEDEEVKPKRKRKVK